MSAFRRVEDGQAGPDALGILVPPGRKTFLILRPRSLACDLLLLAVSGLAAFRELHRDEAAQGAQAVYRALEAWSSGRPGIVEVVPRGEGGFFVRASFGGFAFLACSRQPGQPYQPLLCSEIEGAGRVARAIAAVLCPPAGGEQEVYFNTRNFSR
jgi:hypothetical protein